MKEGGCLQAVKMMEKINNMEAAGRVTKKQQEGKGSPDVLLEQPFIRCSKLWGYFFSF